MRPSGRFRSLWQARWLLLQWIRRDFTVQYRQSALGVLWAVVQPMSLLLFYGVVFSRVLAVEAPAGSYAVFALCGLVPWTFVSATLYRSAASLVGASYIVRQVYFPRAVVPLSAVGTSLVDLGMATGVLLVAQALSEQRLHLATLALVPLAICLVILLAGVAIYVAMIGALVRDLRFVIGFVVQIGFIVTPVMYPRELAPKGMMWLYNINPVSWIIEAQRAAVIEGHWPSPTILGVLLGSGLLLTASAIVYSAAIEDRLPDLL